MYNQVQMYTTSGRMQVIYPKDFPMMVKRVIANSNSIEIIEQHPSYANPNIVMDQLPNETESSFVRKTLELKEYCTIGLMDLTGTNSGALLQNTLDVKSIKAENAKVFNDFKLMVANKKPELFVKDLSLESIEQLSKQYMMGYGGEDPYGMEIFLGRYQKFFVMFSTDYLEFFKANFQDFSRNCMILKGQLVNIKPSSIVLARYEDSVFMKELSINTYRPDHLNSAEGETVNDPNLCE